MCQTLHKQYLPSSFLFILCERICIHVCTFRSTYCCWHVNAMGKIVGVSIFPATMCVLGIEFWSSGLVVNTFIYWAISLFSVEHPVLKATLYGRWWHLYSIYKQIEAQSAYGRLFKETWLLNRSVKIQSHACLLRKYYSLQLLISNQQASW